MDKLSLAFAEAAAIQAIENCRDLAELKKLTLSVTKAYFTSRGLLNTLMKDNIQLLANSPCRECPRDLR